MTIPQRDRSPGKGQIKYKGPSRLESCPNRYCPLGRASLKRKTHRLDPVSLSVPTRIISESSASKTKFPTPRPSRSTNVFFIKLSAANFFQKLKYRAGSAGFDFQIIAAQPRSTGPQAEKYRSPEPPDPRYRSHFLLKKAGEVVINI